MKKSLLLSSIMALVLVIALSTATFAWYGSSTEVTANMSTLTAASGAGNLQISEDKTTWSSNISLETPTSKFVPATINYDNFLNTEETAVDLTANFEKLKTLTNWVIGTENADGSNKLSAVANGTTDNNFFVTYKFYLQNAGSEAFDVTIANPVFSDADGTEASGNLELDMRWIIVVTKGEGVGATNTVFNCAFNATDLQDSGNDALAEAVAKKPVNASNGEGEAMTINMAADDIVTVTVYTWIDGWDATSDTANNSQKGQVNTELSFSIPTGA